MICLLLLTLAYGVRGETSTPSSLLGPRHYNYHPFEVRQYLEETSVAPTKKGPVLFPVSPPSPRLPLIVTSRPLLESIARSDLAQNNSAPASSLINSVYKPYSTRVQQYQPFVPSVPYGQNPVFTELKNEYDDYGQRPTLPPIYKAISDHANNNLLKASRKHETKTHRPSKEDYHQYNDVSSENTDDYEQNKNYAFSYTVKDHKTGDDFSHSQRSSGSATNGEYRVRLPDGRMQIVSYTADENGYNANVRYDTDTPSNRIDNHNANNHNIVNNNAYNHKTVDNYIGKYHNIVDNNILYNHNTVNNNNGKYHNIVDNNIAYNHNTVDNNNAYTHNAVDNNAFTHGNYGNYNLREEIPIKEDNNEYYNDYSSEYNDKSYKVPNKFALYSSTPTKSFVSTLRPSFDEIKDLFTNIQVTPTPNYDFQVTPTPNYHKYNDQTEKVIVIGSNRYTDVRSTISNFQNPTTPYFVPDLPVTSKPILSQNYIDRINKYLTFN